MHRLLILTMMLILPFVSTSSISAQATCDLTPLTLPLFDSTPIAEFATPQASPTASDLTNADAQAVLEQYVACTNTGDPTLVWAMFTPRWFSVEFADSQEHYLPAFEYEIANGHQQVVNPMKLDSIEGIEKLDDGRFGVTATFSSGDMAWTDQLILANIDGQWLIDDVVLISPPN